LTKEYDRSWNVENDAEFSKGATLKESFLKRKFTTSILFVDLDNFSFGFVAETEMGTVASFGQNF
jgi:hypothetical protein